MAHLARSRAGRRDSYLDAVWRSLLAEYPSQVGSFLDTATFLDAAVAAGESIDRFLDTWDVTLGPAADRHLADTVNGLNFMARRLSTLGAWPRRETVRYRLYRASERDHATSWADDLARGLRSRPHVTSYQGAFPCDC